MSLATIESDSKKDNTPNGIVCITMNGPKLVRCGFRVSLAICLDIMMLNDIAIQFCGFSMAGSIHDIVQSIGSPQMPHSFDEHSFTCHVHAITPIIIEAL